MSRFGGAVAAGLRANVGPDIQPESPATAAILQRDLSVRGLECAGEMARVLESRPGGDLLDCKFRPGNQAQRLLHSEPPEHSSRRFARYFPKQAIELRARKTALARQVSHVQRLVEVSAEDLGRVFDARAGGKRKSWSRSCGHAVHPEAE
jgi:hypothetical protein